jgi:hypothetical protein
MNSLSVFTIMVKGRNKKLAIAPRMHIPTTMKYGLRASLITSARMKKSTAAAENKKEEIRP